MLYKQRERFEDISIKVGIAFSRLRISPNQWTLLSLLPVLASVYMLFLGNYLAAAFLFLVSAFMDLIDGSVARVTGRTTSLGAYLDTIVDRYVEFLIIFGILLSGIPAFYLPGTAWLLVYLFGSMMTTYAKSSAKEKGLTRLELRGGILERAERLVILFVGLVLAAFDPIYLTYVVAGLAVLSNVSALQRIRTASLKARDSF